MLLSEQGRLTKRIFTDGGQQSRGRKELHLQEVCSRFLLNIPQNIRLNHPKCDLKRKYFTQTSVGEEQYALIFCKSNGLLLSRQQRYFFQYVLFLRLRTLMTPWTQKVLLSTSKIVELTKSKPSFGRECMRRNEGRQLHRTISLIRSQTSIPNTPCVRMRCQHRKNKYENRTTAEIQIDSRRINGIPTRKSDANKYRIRPRTCWLAAKLYLCYGNIGIFLVTVFYINSVDPGVRSLLSKRSRIVSSLSITKPSFRCMCE